MNVLVDAQLPRRLAWHLREAGHDAVHTLDLPGGNRTTDAELNQISIREQRVLVTKDADFVESFVLLGQPYKLLLVSTGNVTNAELDSLLVPRLAQIAAALATVSFVEVTSTMLVLHA